MLDNAAPSAGEIRAFARQLLAWAEHLDASPLGDEALSDVARHELILALAEASLRTTLLRADLYGEARLDDPLWAVMLDLFVKEAKGRRVTIDHVLSDHDASRETIRRSLERLTGMGLVVAEAERSDEWNVWLSLSAEAREKMTALLLEPVAFLGRRGTEVPNDAAGGAP